MVMNEQESWKNKEHPSVGGERRAFLREHDLNGALEREWGGKDSLGRGGGLVWSARARLGKKGVCAGWECLGSHSPKNIRRGSSSRDPGVLEPRCGGRSVHMEERVMTAVKRLFTYWGINQRGNHIKGSGKQISPHHRREKTKQVQGCWTETESISVNIWLFNIYQGR